jgi:hypothetical protein
MRIETASIVHSAQVWVCDACGCQDAKSCGCNSTAHQEELAARREQARKRQQKHRAAEKTNENNNHVTRDMDVENIEKSRKHQQNQNARGNRADVENIDESEPEEKDHLELDGSYAVVDYKRPPRMRVDGFLFRANESVRGARMDNMAGLVTKELLEAARDAATAWGELYRAMEVEYGQENRS